MSAHDYLQYFFTPAAKYRTAIRQPLVPLKPPAPRRGRVFAYRRTVKPLAPLPGDLAARYGGEEFVLLLPETGAQEAQMLAEELRAKLEAHGLTHPASPVGASVTLSIGGASTTPMQAEADPAFFPLADAALYQAKASGRNCVRWAAA